MPKGSHDVTRGITVSSGGEPLAPEVRLARREEMLQACTPCHAPAFARKELARGDTILEQSRALVKEAEGIIGDLADHGLLDPMPQDRPPHPVRGHALVLDSQMLYEDTSHIERLFFKMKKYDYAKAIKGAFHQNPAYTHWYGNAELKMDLVDIQSEAHRLRERGKSRSSIPEETVHEHLRALKRAFDRGVLTPEAYEQEKTKLLKRSDKQ
jgi:hydroxylamine dehydrogenase